MKTYIPYSLILVAASAGMAFGAETAYTTPVGYVTVPLPGKATAGAANRLQIASEQLLPPNSTEFAGVAESFSGNVLTDAQGTWAAGSFVNATPPAGFPAYSHLVQITSGPLLGTFSWITGSSANTITTFDNISAAGPNASYRIVKAFTIATLLGAVPPATVLGGGTSAAAADNFQIYNSFANTYTTFYYKNGGAVGGTGWRTSASNSLDVSSVAIHPTDSGLVFTRKQVGDGSLVIAGDVKVGATDVLIRGKAGTGPTTNTLNIVQAPIPVDQLTLGASGLYTGVVTTGLLGGTSAAAADNVLIFNAATNTYTTYYYKNGGAVGGTGWRTSASNSVDVSAVALPSNSAILIQRKGAAATDFTWEIPTLNIAQ
jgi:hypothetical protein